MYVCKLSLLASVLTWDYYHNNKLCIQLTLLVLFEMRHTAKALIAVIVISNVKHLELDDSHTETTGYTKGKILTNKLSSIGPRVYGYLYEH